MVLEYAVGLGIRYAVPDLPEETLHIVYFAGLALAIAGCFVIIRYFPNSKEPAFDKPRG